MPPKQGKKKANQYTANQLFTGFMVATMSFLAFAMWPEMTETRGYDKYITSLGVKRGRVETACTGSGSDRVCGLVAKRNIDRGENVITIPMTSIIQPHTLASQMPALNAESPELAAGFAEAGLPANYFYPAFAMTFKLWHEKKMGSSSELSAWFDLLPATPNHAMFFLDNEATCLDRISFDERNTSLTYAAGFATVAKHICDANKDLYSCSYLNAETLESEFKWAFATMVQRTWGDIRNPMLIPMVDLAFQHPQLCNPKGDGDVKCVSRDKQFFLQPTQENENTLVMKSINYALQGEPVYSLDQARAPWETLAIYGYADHAASVVPDLEFINRFNMFSQEHKVAPDALSKDHPLKECGQRQSMTWGVNGQPKKELRKCWAALFYFTEHPDHVMFDVDAQNAYAEWKADDVEQAKSRFLAWRHTGAAAQHIAQVVTANRGEHCNEDSGRMPAIKETQDILKSIFGKIEGASQKKIEQTFKKWAELDESARMDVPEPQAPAKEEIETVEADEGNEEPSE